MSICLTDLFARRSCRNFLRGPHDCLHQPRSSSFSSVFPFHGASVQIGRRKLEDTASPSHLLSDRSLRAADYLSEARRLHALFTAALSPEQVRHSTFDRISLFQSPAPRVRPKLAIP